MPTCKEAESTVRNLGYKHVYTWRDSPNAHYPPHTHATATTHLILDGEMTISLESGEKETFGSGALVDVGKRQLHEVWIGAGGCEYVIGE